MTSRDTIEITDGLVASTPRLALKQQLERYGEIDICHKIGDPKEDTPWVRFRDCSAAQEALQAIERGEVTLDGFTIKAQWRARKKEPVPIPQQDARDPQAATCSWSAARGAAAEAGAAGTAEVTGAAARSAPVPQEARAVEESALEAGAAAAAFVGHACTCCCEFADVGGGGVTAGHLLLAAAGEYQVVSPAAGVGVFRPFGMPPHETIRVVCAACEHTCTD
eukprot:CAMPEP_0171072494 /NCGR_PEP_ID=MMETSP0766_2-20121228/10896_1 /TAXON_ID=439317 /ORGANISM="Gambierdiscus australes, Strain CAWD 149" /LENGTH=221 /DNA_ID=CAMNT_0011529085 /DNA_START=123 /DNA_END=788 /DNA_ORIENTATION=+